jgi:hypothetical protein
MVFRLAHRWCSGLGLVTPVSLVASVTNTHNISVYLRTQGLTAWSLCKSGKVDVVVDTISQKTYCHHPLISQEQPLSIKILSDYSSSSPLWYLLILKSNLYLMTN